jgi:hypothetical protein
MYTELSSKMETSLIEFESTWMQNYSTRRITDCQKSRLVSDVGSG